MASVDVVVVERGGKHGAISGERGDYFHHAQEEWLVTSHCSDDDEKPAEKVSLHCNAQGSVVQVFFITCENIAFSNYPGPEYNGTCCQKANTGPECRWLQVFLCWSVLVAAGC